MLNEIPLKTLQLELDERFIHAFVLLGTHVMNITFMVKT